MEIAKDIKNVNNNIGGKSIEEVKKFSSVSQSITEDILYGSEIRSRITVAKNAFQEKQMFLSLTNMDIELWKRWITLLIWLIALYGSEVWTKENYKLSRLDIVTGCRESVSWKEKTSNKQVLEFGQIDSYWKIFKMSAQYETWRPTVKSTLGQDPGEIKVRMFKKQWHQAGV